MKINTVKFSESGNGKEHGRYSVLLDIPYFTDETAAAEKMNRFYSEYTELIRSAAYENSLIIMSSIHKTYSGEDGFCFFSDITVFKSGNTVDFFRVSDNRDERGAVLRPGRRIKKFLRGYDGWYRTENGFTVYKNRFTPENISGVRRSDYSKLFIEAFYVT